MKKSADRWSIWLTTHWGKRFKRRFDSRINRWTGQPHEHRREIARRKRQGEARSAL